MAKSATMKPKTATKKATPMQETCCSETMAAPQKVSATKGSCCAETLALGKVQRVILHVSNFDRAVKFYTETLGLKLQSKSEGWAELATGGTEIDLHEGRKSKPSGDDPSLCFSSDNFDATYSALKSRGVNIGAVFKPCGDLRCASFTDPDGNRLGIEG